MFVDTEMCPYGHSGNKCHLSLETENKQYLSPLFFLCYTSVKAVKAFVNVKIISAVYGTKTQFQIGKEAHEFTSFLRIADTRMLRVGLTILASHDTMGYGTGQFLWQVKWHKRVDGDGETILQEESLLTGIRTISPIVFLISVV